MEERKVPVLRFPEFEGEWNNNRVGEITDCIVPGRNKPRKFLGDIPWVTTPDLTHNQTIKESNIDLRISRSEVDEIGSKVVPKNSIIITCVGELGIVVKTGVDIVINQQLHAFLPSKIVIPEFLLYSLSTKKGYMDKVATRTSVIYMNKDNCNSIPVSYPLKPEQQKIASFLSVVDTKIEQLTRKKELLEQYKKGVMQKLFPKPGEQHPELRFKQEDGSDFPDWEVKRLGELTFKVGRKNKENIPYPIYSINNQEGFLPQSDQFEGLDSVDRGYDISMYKIIHPETFAYNPARINVGSIGYSYDLDKVIISSLYVCFKTKPELADEYLLAFIDTYQFNNFVLRYQEGGVRQYLFYENFSSIKLPLPSVEEQQKIALFLGNLDRRISEMNNRITKTQTFKKGLLQQMFV